MRNSRAKFDAVFFDLDGLLVETSKLYRESEDELLSEYGKSVDDQLFRKLLGRIPIDACRIIIEEFGLPISPEEFLDKRDRIMKMKLESQVEPREGMNEIINQFSGKIPLALVTSSDKEFMIMILEHFKLKRKFKVLQSSEGIKNGKPHPEIYVTASAKMGVYASSVIAVEDSVNGCRSAHSAGCYTVAVPSPFDVRENFDFTDFVADNLIMARDHIRGILSRPVF